MQKLPIGIQDFPDLRENNYIYIDKTMYISKLVDTGKYIFYPALADLVNR